MSHYLQRRISAVRAKHATVSAGTGITMAVAWFVGILVASVVADWWLNLSPRARALILLLNLAGALYFLVRYALVPIVRRADDETLALAIERIAPSFRTRLIAAIQFSRPGAITPGESGALVSAMIQQTERIAANVNFLAVIPADRLARWTGIAAGLLLGSAALYAYGGETSPILLRRAFLEQVALPHKTRVEVLSGSYQVATGERALLSARAIGWHPESGTAEITYASGRSLMLPLKRDLQKPDTYAVAIDAVPESFRYRIRLYDGTSDSFDIAAEERPVVQSLACFQVFPAYTGLDNLRRQPTDLLVLAGSRLRLSIQTNKPLQPNTPGKLPANIVHLQNLKETSEIPAVALQPDPSDPRRWTAEISLPENIAGFSIHLVDLHGLESKNPPFYPVDLLPDRPPAVRITAPERRELLVTSEATASIGFVAEDDFGLASLTLRYKIDDQSEKSIHLVITPGDRQVRGYYPWQVSKLTPPPDKPSLEGCVIEFYVEARDANDVTGTGITASEHYQLRVVSKSDKQAELIARMAESFSTIHDVSDSQENAAAELGSLITEQSVLPTPRPPAPPTPVPPPGNSQPNR